MIEKLTFKVKKTSLGNLVQGIELPEIILELPPERDLETTICSAISCYRKSFREDEERYNLVLIHTESDDI